MYKIFIYGDSSHWHAGSKAVIQYLYHLIRERGFKVVHSWEEADCVIINGEGSMHDNAGTNWLVIGNDAKNAGKQVHFINTVWQNMTIPEIEFLKRFDSVIVRELISYNEIKSVRPDASIHTDISYNFPVTIPTRTSEDIIVGGFFGGGEGITYNTQPPTRFPEGSKFLSIKGFPDWQTYLNALASAKFLITGLHHEVIAACKLRVPFIAYRGNTDKVLGIIERAGADIPVARDPFHLALNIKNYLLGSWPPQKEYDKLFDFLEKEKPFDLTDLGL